MHMIELEMSPISIKNYHKVFAQAHRALGPLSVAATACNNIVIQSFVIFFVILLTIKDLKKV